MAEAKKTTKKTTAKKSTAKTAGKKRTAAQLRAEAEKKAVHAAKLDAENAKSRLEEVQETAVEYAKMTGLPEFVSEPMHDGQCFGHDALGGRVLLTEAEQTECQMVALFVCRLREVTTLFETEQHAEDLGDGAVEPSRYFAYSQTRWGAGKEFQNIQTFFESGSRIVSLGCSFSHESPWATEYTVPTVTNLIRAPVQNCK